MSVKSRGTVPVGRSDVSTARVSRGRGWKPSAPRWLSALCQSAVWRPGGKHKGERRLVARGRLELEAPAKRSRQEGAASPSRISDMIRRGFERTRAPRKREPLSWQNAAEQAK